MKNSDMPAMPQQATSEGYPCYYYDYDGPGIPTGMTKREMMAMHAMAHLMPDQNFESYASQAKIAVLAADALLAELERTK